MRKLLLIGLITLSVATIAAGGKKDKPAGDVREFTWEWMKDQEPNYYPPTSGVAEQAIGGPLAGVEEVIFAVRANGRDWHWYANFGYNIHRETNFYHGGRGGHLMALNLRTGETRTILADAEGDIRDPAVHYDGKTILFAYRKGGQNQYHLYTIQSDGSGLTQLTEGKYDDFEPCWMPDGTIMFISSRCRRWVPCWYAQVAIMFRCEADGSNIRQISAGVETENTPWPLSDGRIIYTRWEYVDRGQSNYHGLWTVNPDGTKQMIFFDNQGRGMTLYIDAKPIPGSADVVTIISPKHGRNEHRGRMGLINTAYGPDSEKAVRFIDRGYPDFNAEKKKGHLPDNTWRDPYPVSSDCLLAATKRSLVIMNGQGHYEPIYTLGEEGYDDLWVHEPRPLVARQREPVIPDAVNPSAETGTLILADIRVGRRMDDVPRGQIKSLLILEEMPRPVAKCAYPDAVGLQSNYVLHRVLGTVPVDSDGSAHFKVPAGRPLFLVAQDETGRSVKKMHSFFSVMQGETTSCVGCHEHRTRTPREKYDVSTLLAVQDGPDEIRPVPGVPRIFDYVRDIQPIWDKHCIQCHNYDKYAGDLVLEDDLNPAYSTSYSFLVRRRLLDIKSSGNRAPYDGGTGDSRLYEVLVEGHKKVKLSELEMRMVRTWIDASATFAGSYAAIGDASRDNRVPKDLDYSVLEKNCYECHVSKYSRKGVWIKGHEMRKQAWMFNIERPEKSLLLLAPLAREAGGLGICKKGKPRRRGDVEAPEARIFTGKDDPAYQALKKLTMEIIDRYDDRKRWYQAGFVPRDFYVREMKRFGALGEDFDPERDTLDPWKVDKRYFDIINRGALGQWE